MKKRLKLLTMPAVAVLCGMLTVGAVVMYPDQCDAIYRHLTSFHWRTGPYDSARADN